MKDRFALGHATHVLASGTPREAQRSTAAHSAGKRDGARCQSARSAGQSACSDRHAPLWQDHFPAPVASSCAGSWAWKRSKLLFPARQPACSHARCIRPCAGAASPPSSGRSAFVSFCGITQPLPLYRAVYSEPTRSDAGHFARKLLGKVRRQFLGHHCHAHFW